MVCLALDTSINNTGWCIRNLHTNNIIDYGVIKTDKKQNSIQKIIFIEQKIKELWQKYLPIYIIIEEMSVCRNMQTMRKLIGLIEHLEIEFTKLEALVIRVTPSAWRKNKIKGKTRQELKEASRKYVKEHYGLDVSDDESDAIIISEYKVEIERIKI